jgi:hypothetical protein
MNLKGICLILGAALILAGAGPALALEKGSLWDGSQWKDLSKEIKVAYVKGICNMADFEVGVGLMGRAACISKAFVDELKTKSIGQVVDEVDKYYKENPAKASTPVIEVILRRCTTVCPPEAAAGGKK